MMKQQCWKQLRQQLCHKDKWIKDQDQLKCQHCNKQFIPILRRRHHCRFCGNIFCSNCSDFFLNGKYLGLNEKFIRHCEFCHQKIQKFIKDCSKINHIYPQQQPNQQQQSKSSQSQNQQQQQFQQDISITSQSYKLNLFFVQNQYKINNQIINKIDQQIKQHIDNVSISLCEKFKLDINVWSKKISEIANRTAVEVKMDTFTSQGPYQSSMDIIKQVKIRTLVTQPDKITCILLKGLVLQKNLPSKHMPTHLNKPKILLIQNSIDLQSFTSQMKFQQLLKNQKIIMKKILQKISKLCPDIIFVQGNINIQAIQYFQSKNIAVVNKIKKKDLQLIMQISNIKKTVKKLWLIQKYKPQNILGICDKIYFKTIKQGQTFMFVQVDVGKRTILLGECTQESTGYLKKTMQLLLRYARQINLEKYLITVDSQLMFNLNKHLQFPFITQLNHEIYKSPQLFGSSQQLSFTKIIFGQIKYNIAPKQLIQYGQKIGKSVFYQNCQNVLFERKKIYSNGDITLSGYLLLNIALNQKQCRKCEYSHTQRYYFKNNSMVTIRFSKHHLYSNPKQSILKNLSQKQRIKQQNNKQTNQLMTLQHLKHVLKKQKSKLIIQTYIYCQICQSKLNLFMEQNNNNHTNNHNNINKHNYNSIKVGKSYLQNSFFYFINLLSKSFILNNKQQSHNNSIKLQKSNNKKIRKLSLQKCQHNQNYNHNDMIKISNTSTLSRVFQYSNTMVKFTIQEYEKYQLYVIDIRSQQGRKNIQQNQLKFFNRLKQTQIKQKQSFLQQIYSIINTFPFHNNNTSSSFSNYSSFSTSMSSTSMKFIQKYQRFQKSFCILQTLSTDFNKFKQSHIIQSDWTLFLREIYKYEYIMKLVYQIMEYFESYVKKKKINQNNKEINQDNSGIEDYDKISDYNQSQKQHNLNQSFNSINNNSSSISVPSVSMHSNTLINQLNKQRKQSQNKQTSKNHILINKIRRQRFPKYQGIFLKYMIGHTYAPVSIIACALNSPQLLALMSQFSTSHNKKDILKLKLPFSSKIKTSLSLKQQIDLIYKQLIQPDPINKSQTYQITIYFPEQFQKLRIRQGVSFDLYVKSLCGCENWNTSGGKSVSLFAKAHNQILVVKIIKTKQFVEFKKFAEDYLNYIESKKKQKKDSLLAKIYGIYEISMRGKQYNLVVMQNLFFGIQNITKVYDLKGSQVNRLFIPEDDKPFTGLDTNFKIDKDNNPYILQSSQYDRIMQVLQHDSNFLKQQQVIDYSLLAIECVQNGKKQLKLGIIDFMRPYHIFEKFQSMYKKVTKGNDPTVIPPDDYAERFFLAMKKYFAKVQQ